MHMYSCMNTYILYECVYTDIHTYTHTHTHTHIYTYTHTHTHTHTQAQLLKNPPAMQETWVPSLGWEDPLEKGKATQYSILA